MHDSNEILLATAVENFLGSAIHERAPTPANSFAISVFDDWLGPKRYHELDCDEAEQFRRDERHNAFCHLLRKNHEVMFIRFDDIYGLGKPILHQFSSDAEFKAIVDAHDGDRTSSQFFVLAIPDLGCIYEQHWDDTNILWFSPATDLTKLGELIFEAGLHVIQFMENPKTM